MSDKEVLELVIGLVSGLNKLIKDVGQFYISQGNIYRECDKLNDADLAGKIKGVISEINPQVEGSVDTAIVQIETLFQEAEEKLDPVEKALSKRKATVWLPATRIRRTKRYLEDCKKYSAHKDLIIKTEVQIITSPVYVDKLHDPIRSDKEAWDGYLHARLTDKIRIMYLWDSENREIIFDAIIAKDTLKKQAKT